jgi:CheY-like chemotaxis protein
MTRLLMVEADAHLVSGVARALLQYGVTITAVATLEQALDRVRRETFALAIIDSNLVSPGELEPFAAAPLVITASFLAPELAQRFARSARLLKKPFTSAELSQVLNEEIGLSVNERSLVDVLSRGHLSRNSFGLRVGEGGEGELVLENGELVHAAFAGIRGEAALVQILAGGGAVVRTAPRSTARTIDRPFRPLLFDALRHVEEIERVRALRVAGRSHGAWLLRRRRR